MVWRSNKSKQGIQTIRPYQRVSEATKYHAETRDPPARIPELVGLVAFQEPLERGRVLFLWISAASERSWVGGTLQMLGKVHQRSKEAAVVYNSPLEYTNFDRQLHDFHTICWAADNASQFQCAYFDDTVGFPSCLRQIRWFLCGCFVCGSDLFPCLLRCCFLAFFCPSPLPFGGSTVLSLTHGPAGNRTTTGSLSPTSLLFLGETQIICMSSVLVVSFLFITDPGPVAVSSFLAHALILVPGY